MYTCKCLCKVYSQWILTGVIKGSAPSHAKELTQDTEDSLIKNLAYTACKMEPDWNPKNLIH